MADLTERIIIPEVPRVLDGQELYVYIPKQYVNSYTKVETDDLLATKFDKSNVAQTTGDSADKVMSQEVVTEQLDTKLDKALIPSEYLPSYVDDVLEYDNRSSFPATGETGKIYVDKSTNLTYRWSGTTYILVGGGDLYLKNGTGDVLIQTTDANQSFKVMKDGRIKAYGEPIENNDTIRLKEFQVLTQSQVDSLF